MWQTLEQRWGKHARLLTLLDDSASGSLDSSTIERLWFGARMVAVQALRDCDWIFYTHLAVARVQAFVPPPIRRPYAVFIHGIEAWRPLSTGQLGVLKGATLRVANSSFTAKRVAALHPDLGTIAVCPLALSHTHGNGPAPAKTSLDLGRRAVIIVARMSSAERYKGHDELLEAWPSVMVRVPDACLVFVGDGDDLSRLKAKAGALDVDRAVVFTGFVSEAELLTLYRRAAVFAMPSRGEGFGLVYLEAMSQRLPCIGSLEDAASEIIVDGTTGFLIHQSDREGLADRIVRLLTDQPLRAAMGAAGHQRLQDRFTYEEFSRTLLALVDSTFGASLAACEPDAVV